MSEIQEFTVNVHRSEDDHSLWAEVVELPGCFATGDDLDELRESLQEAIALYLHDDPEGSVIRHMQPKPVERCLEVDQMRVKVPA